MSMGRRLLSAAMNPTWPADVGTGRYRLGSPVEGLAPIGPTKFPPGVGGSGNPSWINAACHFAGSVMEAFCGRARHGMERAENRLGSVAQRHGCPTAGLRRPGLMAPL